MIYKIIRPFFKEEYLIIAGFKARYLTGNNQYLFSYLENNEPNFKYFFYTKDKEVYRMLNSIYKGKILYTYHLSTFIKILKSKVIIITSGYDDLSPYPLIKSKSVINIWHGIPIKKVGFPAEKSAVKQFVKFTNTLDYFSVSADFDGEIIKSAFRISNDKVFISGLCKNDFINISQKDIITNNLYLQKKVIIYAPTFRDVGMKILRFDKLFPIDKLNALLEKYDAYFLYRSHFNTEESKAVEGYDRIKSASSREFLDPQPLLFHSDIMITDYSGIYFDYLLINKPIIFYNYDYEEYTKKRDFLYSYEENTPGPKVQTQYDLMEAIETYLLYPEKDAEFRERIKNRFHKYPEGGACERTYKLIKDLM
jgi:CDP-glycerol glycerophosphotransferase